MTSETMVSLMCDAQNALVRVKYWINDGQDPDDYNARTGDLQDVITLLQEVQKNVMKEGQ